MLLPRARSMPPRPTHESKTTSVDHAESYHSLPMCSQSAPYRREPERCVVVLQVHMTLSARLRTTNTVIQTISSGEKDGRTEKKRVYQENECAARALSKPYRPGFANRRDCSSSAQIWLCVSLSSNEEIDIKAYWYTHSGGVAPTARSRSVPSRYWSEYSATRSFFQSGADVCEIKRRNLSGTGR